MSAKGQGFVSLDFDDAALQRALSSVAGGFRGRARTELDSTGKDLRSVMRGRLTRHGKGGGRLWRAIEYQVRDYGPGFLVEVGPRIGDPGVEPYDVVIDVGRRPGSRMPPPEPIRDWMARKGIPAEAEFPIRRAIAEHGLQNQPFPYLDVTAERSAAALKAADRLLTWAVSELEGPV